MNQEQLAKKFKEELASWYASQANQTSGYEYEKSFTELWLKLGREVFQESLGEGVYQKNKKKK